MVMELTMCTQVGLNVLKQISMDIGLALILQYTCNIWLKYYPAFYSVVVSLLFSQLLQ